MNIVFLGAPGSGKGTQSALLAKRLFIPVISTGDILRGEVEENSPLGIVVSEHMNSGKLVSDEIVIKIVAKRILSDDCKKGFILDGFPRTEQQAISLDKVLNSLGVKINVVFLFEVSDEVLIKRISGRFYCEDCKEMYNVFFKGIKRECTCDNCGSHNFIKRSDDSELVIRNRLKVYNDTMVDLKIYYVKKDLIFSVDALESIDSIFKKLNGKIDSL